MIYKDYLIRAMQTDDISRLVEIRPSFVSTTGLRVEKSGEGYEIGWRLVEVLLETPFDKGNGYDFDPHEREAIADRLAEPDSLEEVVIERSTGQLVGILDVASEEWRRVAWIWNIMLDEKIRGLGLGRILIERCIAWARSQRLRAVMLETQTNNVPACKFYMHMGFQLVGINDAFYTNRDLERGEVALFWSYPLRVK